MEGALLQRMGRGGRGPHPAKVDSAVFWDRGAWFFSLLSGLRYPIKNLCDGSNPIRGIIWVVGSERGDAIVIAGAHIGRGLRAGAAGYGA